MTQKFILYNRQCRDKAIEAVRLAGDEYIVTITEPKRNLDQNALLHATLSEISEQVVWHGNKLSVDVWKRLCVAAWLREKKENPMLVPALDGNGIDVIYQQTSKLTTTQCSELIEWCFAFGAEHGVKFRDLENIRRPKLRSQ